MNRSMLIAGLVFLVAIGLTLALGGRNPEVEDTPSTMAPASPDSWTAVLYHDPNCGCCGQYVAYLREHGVDVDVRTVSGTKMTDVKARFGIDPSMQSCHTMEIGGYAVEGHVPLEAIEKLLAERPEARGITLPGMPTGSPGMNGPKTGPFEVYRITDDGAEPYLTL